jgi:hypothetical protein
MLAGKCPGVKRRHTNPGSPLHRPTDRQAPARVRLVMTHSTTVPTSVHAPAAASGPPGPVRDRYAAAAPFDDAVAAAVANAELWRNAARLTRVPDDAVARAAAVPGRWHLLALSEDWCGDAVNTLPHVARLADQAPNLDLRVLARDENLDLMDAHLTGIARAIPVVIVYDADFVERGWWGPRPTPLQQWVLGPEGQALDKTQRYRHVRAWYARDRGRTTLDEVIGLLERAAAA